MYSFVLFCLLLLSVTCLSVSIKYDVGERQQSLEKGNDIHKWGDSQLISEVVAALSKVVNYYEDNYSLLNFDGIFGAKIVEGQLNLLVAEFKKGFHGSTMDEIMAKELQQIAYKAGRVVKLSIPFLHEKNASYLRRLRHLLQLPWDIGHSHRIVDESLIWDKDTINMTRHQEFNEEESDICMSEILEPLKGKICQMSEKCIKMMTGCGLEKYLLVHQILYTLVVDMGGCSSRLEQWLVSQSRSGSVEQLQGEFCTNLHQQFSRLAKLTFTPNNDFRTHDYRDLVLEMEMVCGMLGYVEFMKQDWLIMSLGWQTPQGCFPVDPTQRVTVGRKLLIEQKLTDGCLSHLTTVAAGALAVHLRYLLDPGPPETAKLLLKKMPSLSRSSGVIRQEHDKHISPPSEIIEPPRLNVFRPISPPSEKLELPRLNVFRPDQTGLMVPLNQPIFREDTSTEYNRVAEEEKSLEDKVDTLLRILEKEKHSPKKVKPKKMVDNSVKSNGFVFIRSKPQDFEENPAFVQYFKSPHTTKAGSSEVSAASLYYVIASIFLVSVIIFRYIQTRKRSTGKHRNRFRI